MKHPLYLCLILIFISLSCNQDGAEEATSAKDKSSKQMLVESKQVYSPVYEVGIKELKTSSFYRDENNYFRYHPWKALDRNPLTAWNEGVDGPGIGQTFEIIFNQVVTIDKLEIMPGYYDAQWYYHNNRIKNLILYLDEYSLEVKLSDGMNAKEILLPGAMSFEKMIIQIVDVYPGHT